MAATVYDMPDLKKKVRQSDGERQTIYDRVDDVRRREIVPGPQQNTAGRQTQGQQPKTIRRHLVDAALCTLCVILLVGIIVLAVHYNGLTLQNEQLQSEVKKLEAAVKPCPNGWQKFRSSCYYRSTEETNWEESRQHCFQTGADLVIINSKEEQDFIRGLNCGRAESRIGLKKTEGNWTWVDGTPLTPTGYWSSGRPDNKTDHNCANYRHKQGDWMDVNCDDYGHPICEK